MRWLNIGTIEGFNTWSDASTVTSNISETGKCIRLHMNTIKKVIEPCKELWFSFNLNKYENATRLFFVGFNTEAGTPLAVSGQLSPILWNPQIRQFSNDSIIYDPQQSVTLNTNKVNNVEIHIKTGSEGRIDVWFEHKLIFSFRSPSAFEGMGNITAITIGNPYTSQYLVGTYLSSFILQDTRRIGYEKFVKLNIDPATEQNMPQGSTTTYTLSGLSDSSEYSDITGVCAVLQATSRDANINTGTFTLEGADVGTIDVSDSSGRAYEIAHAETNSITGLPFTRDEIEGKTLSFTVNGAE